MSNRLEKVGVATYSPGQPYQPAQEAYCYSQQVGTTPGRMEARVTTTTYYDSQQQRWMTITEIRYVWVSGSPIYEQVCVPAQPEVPAIPPSTGYSSLAGWNGGARSVSPLAGDGYFGFRVAGGSAGVVVGLSAANLSQLPSEPTHGFYIHDEVVYVIESGVVVAQAPTPHVGSNQLRIIRSGNTINYWYDGWTYTSTVPSSGPQYLDAALYLTGDAVYDPVQGQEGTFTAYQQVGVRSGLGHAYDGVGNLWGVRSDTGVAGRAYVNEDGDEVDLLRIVQAVGVLGTVDVFGDYNLGVSSSAGVIGTFRFAYSGAPDDTLPEYPDGGVEAQLPAMAGMASDDPYGQGAGQFRAMTGQAYGQMPEVNVSYGLGIIPPLAGSALMLVGSAGEVDARLEPLTGMAVDGEITDVENYGGAVGSLQPLDGFGATENLDSPPFVSDGLMLTDFFYTDAMARARFSSALELSFVLSAQITIEDFFFDGLALGDHLSFSQTVEAFFESTLHIGTGAGSDRPQVHDYAVNLDSSALSTYDGFAFDQYLRLGGQSYGVRADGLYRITDQPEEQPISVFIDFGASDYGTAQVKTVTEAYLGLFTDGDAYLRVNLDGKEYVYRMRDRGPSARAVLGRGAQGRRWNVALEICDATQFELDSMELLVGVHQRRFYR